MIICVSGMYPVYDDQGLEDGYQIMTSHGYDPETDRTYPLPSAHPRELGARFDDELQEWVLD